MIDKNSRKLLKYFIKNDNQHTQITLACNFKLCDIDNYSAIGKSLKILSECNFIRISHKYNNCVVYSLTNSGRMYFKNKLTDNFKNYFYPIVVATITSTISLLLSLILK